jgi:hypothetical protein
MAPTALHVDSEADAIEVARALAELIVRDGEASAEACDASAESEADLKDGAGDTGMVELMQREGSDGFRDMLYGVRRAVLAGEEYSYRVNWNNGDSVSYWAAPTANRPPKCSDDDCERCYPEFKQGDRVVWHSAASGDVRGTVHNFLPNGMIGFIVAGNDNPDYRAGESQAAYRGNLSLQDPS